MPKFRHPPLTDAVAPGRVGARGARIWVRSSRPGAHRLVLWPQGREEAREVGFEVPADPAFDGTSVVDVDDLSPRVTYRFRIEEGARVVGEGRFRTSPEGVEDSPDAVSFAIASCHLPFGSDGEVHGHAIPMLDAAHDILEERGVERVLFVGDQVYADMPSELSLFERSHFAEVAPAGRKSIFDCTRDEVRRLYQERYRIFWNVEAHRRLQSDFACLPILDDHDIIDNFGTAAEHAEPRWQVLKDGALDAYDDYQALRIGGRAAERPRSFYYSFEHGPVACFVMDLRSERHATADVVEPYTDGQLDDLRRFLARHGRQPVLFLVLSVPFMHAPDWLAKVGEKLWGGEDTDPADRWMHPRMHGARHRLLTLLRSHQRRHPDQRLVVLSGDIHVGLASEIAWCDGTRHLLQLVSSPLSNHQGKLVEQMARLAPEMTTFVGPEDEPFGEARLLASQDDEGDGRNPFGNLNIGLVTVRRRRGEWTVQLELVGYEGSDPVRPRVVFRSAEL